MNEVMPNGSGNSVAVEGEMSPQERKQFENGIAMRLDYDQMQEKLVDGVGIVSGREGSAIVTEDERVLAKFPVSVEVYRDNGVYFKRERGVETAIDTNGNPIAENLGEDTTVVAGFIASFTAGSGEQLRLIDGSTGVEVPVVAGVEEARRFGVSVLLEKQADDYGLETVAIYVPEQQKMIEGVQNLRTEGDMISFETADGKFVLDKAGNVSAAAGE
jgi:hypothetical protein